MRRHLVCLVLRHRWVAAYDHERQQRRRDCRRCGVSEVQLQDLDLNPNYLDPIGPMLGFGR